MEWGAEEGGLVETQVEDGAEMRQNGPVTCHSDAQPQKTALPPDRPLEQ